MVLRIGRAIGNTLRSARSRCSQRNHDGATYGESYRQCAKERLVARLSNVREIAVVLLRVKRKGVPALQSGQFTILIELFGAPQARKHTKYSVYR